LDNENVNQMNLESDGLDEEDSLELATESTIICPHCAEWNTISHDPSGGAIQEYVEDCQVCCRPWRVRVAYTDDGIPNVEVEAAD